ncbi:MAG: polysaccharide deacetylase family protein [Lachnospiraceae bacterium]|nr:polysaccharide deacetylase family protein [Lachnospiraceae bacterium]
MSDTTTDTIEQEVLKRQRDKRKRVHRMKMAIVYFLIIYIIVSIVAIALLGISVFSLQRELKSLGQKVSTLETSKAEAAAQEADMDSGTLVADTKTAEENLAGEDDILKVYLTFDDGPSTNTDKILDILDDYGVKATFFVTGKTDDASKAAMKRIVDEGHTIGMHSFSHDYSQIYSSEAAFEADFTQIQNLIYDTTGVDCFYYRFPGGSSNKVSNTDMAEFIKFLNSQNVTYYDWNVANGDATTQAYTTDDLIENVMSDVVKYKTSVVLMHDAADKGKTVESLPTLIQDLQAKGALILPISKDTTVIQHVKLADQQ